MLYMTQTKKLLDLIILGIIVLCFGINLREISVLWAGASFFLITLEIIISLKDNSWRYIIPRWFLNGLGIFFIVITLYRINWDNAVNVLLECLVCLVAVKWVERKRPRDYLQILALCLFALVSHAFFTISIEYFVAVILVMIGSTAALVILTALSEQGADVQNLPVGWLLGFSIVFLVISLPLSFVLFFILPRTETPFLAFLYRGSLAYSGFSDTVELGSVERIQEDKSVAFRAIIQQEHHKAPFYWRGIVYDSFDGKLWKSTTLEYSRYELFSEKDKFHSESTISQTIIMEPNGNRILFCLDVPYSVRGFLGSSLMNSWKDRVFVTSRSIDKRLKYDCLSLPSPQVAELTREDLAHYTAIPQNWRSAKAINNILEELIGSTRDEIKIAQTILSWLRSPPFEYALSGLPLSETALEDFILKTKRGNCEYFASALAVMLRMAGIPARLVGGYYGAYRHPLASYYLVFQHNAHVWVEAFFTEKTNDATNPKMNNTVKGRWIRLDPTPAPQSFINRPNMDFWFKMRLMLDMVQYYWNMFIVQYDMKEQAKMIRRIARGASDIRKVLSYFDNLKFSYIMSKIRNLEIRTSEFITGSIIGISLLSITVIVFLTGWRSKLSRKKHSKLFRKFERHFEKRYPGRQPSETLKEWIIRINDRLTSHERKRAFEFIEIYERCIYGPDGFNEDNIKRLKSILNDLQSA